MACHESYTLKIEFLVLVQKPHLRDEKLDRHRGKEAHRYISRETSAGSATDSPRLSRSVIREHIYEPCEPDNLGISNIVAFRYRASKA